MQIDIYTHQNHQKSHVDPICPWYIPCYFRRIFSFRPHLRWICLGMCCWQLVGPLPSWWPCWAEPCWCWLERRFPTDVMRLGKTSKTTCLLGICCKKEVAKKSKHIFFKPTHFAMFPQKDQFFFFAGRVRGGSVWVEFFFGFWNLNGSNGIQSRPIISSTKHCWLPVWNGGNLMMEIQIRLCTLVGDYPKFANVEFLHGWGCRIPLSACGDS